MYEHRSEPLLPRRLFFLRLVWHSVLALGIIVVSLLIGIIGYHFAAGFAWLDSLVNTSMILGGMGPVDRIQNVPGKLFASFYALYAGITFLVITGVLVAPIAHRFLHRLHLEQKEDS